MKTYNFKRYSRGFDWKITLFFLTLIGGLVFIIWGSIIYMHAPGMAEARKIAMHLSWKQQLFGIILIVISYVLSYKRK